MGWFSRRSSDHNALASERPNGRRPSRANRRDGGRDSGEGLDPADVEKRRARRRLIGSIALVLGIIVFLPMVFDSGPRPISDDIVVQIPEPNTPFAGSPAPAAPAAPDTPGAVAPTAPDAASPSDPQTDAPPAKAEAEAERPKASAPARTSSPAASASIPAPTAQTPARDTTAAATSAPAATAATAATAASEADGARALALLEGRAPETRPTAPPAKAAYALQIGAFTSAEAVRDVRNRLTGAGLVSYTEVIATQQGKRTRVRVGPFATRESADQARSKVRALGLDATVVTH